MRALTLTNPWAGLVAAGIKLVENRPRHMIRRDHVGQRFAIHASREIDADVYVTIGQHAPDLVGEFWRPLSRITSAVIAVATLDSILDEYDPLGRILGEQARWAFGPICYVLRDVVALRKPVSCRGWQGFWTLDGEVEQRVRAQITEAA